MSAGQELDAIGQIKDTGQQLGELIFWLRKWCPALERQVQNLQAQHPQHEHQHHGHSG